VTVRDPAVLSVTLNVLRSADEGGVGGNVAFGSLDVMLRVSAELDRVPVGRRRPEPSR
jgi:hypothetical protein